MRLVLISDTHNLHEGAFGLSDPWRLPMGDILICAGDITNVGDTNDVENFLEYFDKTEFSHKILIAGNHDYCFENEYRLLVKELVETFSWKYLEDEEVVIDCVKFYGSPWQPWFFDWAFNFPKGEEGIRKADLTWSAIPLDTDILITHGPPRGILDKVKRGGENVGCWSLLDKVLKVKPALHVFGHIHEAYGMHEKNDITFVNASICTLDYIPSNKPFVFDFDPVLKKLTRAHDWTY